MNNRRGSIYILVLGVTTLVLTLGVGGALASRDLLERQGQAGDMLAADAAARSAIELAVANLNNNAAALIAQCTDQLALPTTINGFTTAIAISDPDDGSVGNSPYERLRITALAEHGTTRQYRSIIVEPTINPGDGDPHYHMIPGSYRIDIE